MIEHPKYESWETVTVCNKSEYDDFIKYYKNTENNNFFIGKIENESNYLSSKDSFYIIPENSIPNDKTYFEDLVNFCEKYEADIFSTNSEIRKNANKFSISDITESKFVKIFKISKDGYFFSNKTESFLLHNEKLYLFCMLDGEIYYFMPLPKELNNFFYPIAINCLKTSPINLSDYDDNYFF